MIESMCKGNKVELSEQGSGPPCNVKGFMKPITSLPLWEGVRGVSVRRRDNLQGEIFTLSHQGALFVTPLGKSSL